MKKIYENPELEVIMLKEEDIVTASVEGAQKTMKSVSPKSSEIQPW